MGKALGTLMVAWPVKVYGDVPPVGVLEQAMEMVALALEMNSGVALAAVLLTVQLLPLVKLTS